jgi:formate dehydrogenase major subunit
MNAMTEQALKPETIRFKLNGKDVEGFADETIIEAAARHGVEIPHLCYQEGIEHGFQRATGNCRSCMVEIKGERVLAPACCRKPTPGMEVTTDNERAQTSQKMVLELLLSDMPEDRYTRDSELDHWAAKMHVTQPRFVGRKQPVADLSHYAMAVNLDACIQCTRCVRACREEQGNDVIGFAFRGDQSKIVFDLDDPMGSSTCVACGECVQACPTGALAPARGAALVEVEKKVRSVCPFCGVGCQLEFNVKDNHIVYVEGADGPSNHGRLCVKGRYGFDYVHNRQRLTKPLIRKPGVPKSADLMMDPGNPLEFFREASWEEALDLAASKLKEIRDSGGGDALAGFGSAKGSNEEAYLFQKLVRTGFGGNNVDHCTRFCHASSVTALLEGIGSGAVSNPVSDVLKAEVIFLIGSNPTVNHPVAASWIKNAARRGATLIIADPRRSPDLSRYAKYFLQFNPGADVSLLNAMLHTIITEGLVDKAFIEDRTSGFDALVQNVKGYSPEKMEAVCGIPAQTIKEVARLYAKSKASMILWGMGVSQHVHGTDNARCLIALALSTGQIGRPGTGLHPLRGQNNVQGASDVGLIPMVYPDYQSVTNSKVQAQFEELWGTELSPKTGLTATEIMDAADAGQIRGMYLMGENPAMSDPDANHVRHALAKLDWFVVQEIFLTETAYFADVILPATAWPEKDGTVTNTDRMVQLGRKAIEPPGEARPDLWIIQQIAQRLGLDWNYAGPRDVFNEMRRAMPSIAGITWERLQAENTVTYPCEKEGDPGEPVVFIDSFPTGDGRGRIVPADILPPDERPDGEYPFVLITGRQLEHWHTGAMTRRASALDAIEPVAVASMHPLDLAELGVEPGGVITVTSRRGTITIYARSDDGTPRGAVFIPFCFYEAAVNLVTNSAIDPEAKIPEAKYCAVRVAPGGELQPISSYGGGQILAKVAAPTA